MCVLELASVLAGEDFQPVPVLGVPGDRRFPPLLYDLVDDAARQELIPRAAAVVGSCAGTRVQRRRARLCRVWVAEVARPGFWRRPFWTLLALRSSSRNFAAATYAALVAVDGATARERHGAALDLVDRMLEVGRGRARADELAAIIAAGSQLPIGGPASTRFDEVAISARSDLLAPI